MRRRRLVLLALPLLAWPACAVLAPRTLPIVRLQGPYRVKTWKGGKPESRRTIEPGSDDERAIAAWIAAHDSGWHPTLVTYAPSREIHGQDFHLNFTGNLCVLNHDADGKGRWRQVSREIDADEIPPVFDRPAGP